MKKLLSVLAFGLMVSMQAHAAPMIKAPQTPLKTFVSIDARVLVGGVEQHRYQADIWGKFSARNSIPRTSPGASDDKSSIFTAHSRNGLQFEVVAIAEDRTSIVIDYVDREDLREFVGGTTVSLDDGVFEYTNTISLEKGKELRIPYSVCKDKASKICDRVLSITAN